MPERQSDRMSKITNDGLTRSGTGYFIDAHMATVGFKGLILIECQDSRACRPLAGTSMLELLQVYTSPNHGSSDYATDP